MNKGSECRAVSVSLSLQIEVLNNTAEVRTLVVLKGSYNLIVSRRETVLEEQGVASELLRFALMTVIRLRSERSCGAAD